MQLLRSPWPIPQDQFLKELCENCHRQILWRTSLSILFGMGAVNLIIWHNTATFLIPFLQNLFLLKCLTLVSWKDIPEQTVQNELMKSLAPHRHCEFGDVNLAGNLIYFCFERMSVWTEYLKQDPETPKFWEMIQEIIANKHKEERLIGICIFALGLAPDHPIRENLCKMIAVQLKYLKIECPTNDFWYFCENLLPLARQNLLVKRLAFAVFALSKYPEVLTALVLTHKEPIPWEFTLREVEASSKQTDSKYIFKLINELKFLASEIVFSYSPSEMKLDLHVRNIRDELNGVIFFQHFIVRNCRWARNYQLWVEYITDIIFQNGDSITKYAIGLNQVLEKIAKRDPKQLDQAINALGESIRY